MKKFKKIDESLKERHGIVRQLERVKKENITVDEMEEIGLDLQKSGRRALSPLVRRLWREKSGDVISKYAYLLDFFEDGGWVDQLIQIAIKRKDLEADGKSALLAVLQNSGVDVSLPPLSRLFEGMGPFGGRVAMAMENGDEGLISFLDDFICNSPDAQAAMIRELAEVDDPRAVSILDILLGFDSPDILREALTVAGRCRRPEAAALLHRFLAEGDVSLRPLAEKSLRRLAFTGVNTEALPCAAPLLPFHRAFLSPIDGGGNRALCISRWMDEERLDTLFIVAHEGQGIRDAYGYGLVTEQEYEKLMGELAADNNLLEVEPAYAMLVVRDALYRNRNSAMPLPAEFYLGRRIFRGEPLDPAPYLPAFDSYDLEGLSLAPALVRESAALMDDEYFAGWFIAKPRVYDFAEEWAALEKNGDGRVCNIEFESLVKRFTRELIVPEARKLSCRLFLTADFMANSGRDEGIVEKTIAAAFTIDNSRFPLHRHPFIRRFVVESMDVAREALSEGYDMREHPTDDDDFEEWE